MTLSEGVNESAAWAAPVVGLAEDQIPEALPEAGCDDPSPADRPTSGTLIYGRSRLFSYDSSGLADKKANSCGQQAIATLFDFWDVASFGMARHYPGKPPAQDGRFHFAPQYVEQVFQRFPPESVDLGFWKSPDFTLPWRVEDAFRRYGLKIAGCYSAAGGNGDTEVSYLKTVMRQLRLPAICLVDLDKIYPGQNNMLHYAVVHGYTDSDVIFASWEDRFVTSWDMFRRGWHCPTLPWTCNYRAIVPYRGTGT